jgi:uncharacterized protein (TIGR02646 family)
MIHIERGAPPDIFSSDRLINARISLETMARNAVRQERLKFDFPIMAEVKDTLNVACNGKCAYCESIMRDVSPSNVESFRPKSGARGLDKSSYAPLHYWWLYYEWDNLLISCEVCSQKYKRDFFPIENESERAPVGAKGEELLKEKALLIDPAVEDPSVHLYFDENGKANFHTDKGKVTIDILGLNRQELVSNRQKVGRELMMRLEALAKSSYRTSSTGADLVAYIRELFSEKPSQEYAAMQRVVFDSWYEKNETFWEMVKKDINDSSGRHMVSKQIVDIADNVKSYEIGQQLSSIKRFSIKSIDIENFRSIDKLVLNFLPINEKESRESWLLLLGDNGIGKSSILQAITLTLAGKKQLDKLKLNVHEYLKSGMGSGRVIIQSYEHDDPIELRFDTQGFTTTLTEAPCFVCAYGSTRLLPKGNIQPDYVKEPYLNIKNLFDYSVALNDPQQWLRTLSRTEFDTRVAAAFFDLLNLRGDDRVFIENDKLSIRQFGENHELENNSDGYKSIVALGGDMMQTLSVEMANFHNSYGIVLIDELGNHLHPRWRMKIVSALRKAFPKLQFIVTTHEPLCLRGLSHGEVVVLVRDQENKIRALDSEFLPDHSLLRIDQLLTSDLFGLINVMDDETEKTYEQYYALLSKKETDRTAEDNKKIDEYTSRLADKEMLGSTPQTQALFKMVNENYLQLKKEGFKVTEQLKEETITEVKGMLKKKKLNWLE